MVSRGLRWAAVAALASGLSCASPESAPPTHARTETGRGNTAWFEEVAAARGLAFTHRSGHTDRYLLPEIMGGGAALFDMDNDGDLDAYLVQSGSVSDPARKGDGNRLFRNRGDGVFDDVTTGSGAQAPGYGMGVAAGDYDNDGDVDLYVTNLGSNVLLQGDGTGRFADATAHAGVAAGGWSTSAVFVDYDADGDLDLFVARYIDWSPGSERQCFSLTGVPDYCSPRNYDAPTPDRLFRNNGNGTFTDVTAAAGLQTAAGNGLGVVAADLNDDGRVDIVVANDGTPNHLWINAGGGRFEEEALVNGVALDQDGRPKAGMGVHVADVDGDADQDLLIVNLDGESDSFFRNERTYFVDDTAAVGLRTITRQFTRFGLGVIDFDNDGLLDIFEANGRVGLQSERFSADPYAEPNVLLRGIAGGRFEPVANGGLAQPLIATSRAAAFGDVDGDGGIDVLVVNRDGPAHLLRNVAPQRGHWLSIRAVDSHRRDALGAQLTITAGARRIHADVRAAYSYLASNDARVHVGLGTATRVDQVQVRWPGATTVESFGPFDADRTVTIREGQGR
jgi:enediyne biosynthesis protein E4